MWSQYTNNEKAEICLPIMWLAEIENHKNRNPKVETDMPFVLQSDLQTSPTQGVPIIPGVQWLQFYFFYSDFFFLLYFEKANFYTTVEM